MKECPNDCYLGEKTSLEQWYLKDKTHCPYCGEELKEREQ